MAIKRKPNKSIALAEASRIWSTYGFEDPREMVLEDLALAMGIFVIDAQLDSSAARLVRQGDHGVIRVADRISNAGQRRFAIAHEIGHFIMHRNVTQMLACTDSDVYSSYTSSSFETEASIFAGGLLMPKSKFCKETANRPPEWSVIRNLADVFQTSLTATALRYVETSTDYCAFVISEKGRVRWWRASDTFSNQGFWIENRALLPTCSSAAKYFRDGTTDRQPSETDLEDWLREPLDLESDVAIEHSTPLPKYGQVATLLWLP